MLYNFELPPAQPQPRPTDQQRADYRHAAADMITEAHAADPINTRRVLEQRLAAADRASIDEYGVNPDFNDTQTIFFNPDRFRVMTPDQYRGRVALGHFNAAYPGSYYDRLDKRQKNAAALAGALVSLTAEAEAYQAKADAETKRSSQAA